MGQVTIRSYHGGLGDELQFSTFAEQLTEAGNEVYLYSGALVMPFRNPGIKHFLYAHNPFVKGEMANRWDYGDVPNIPYNNLNNDFIKNWEQAHGLNPVNSLPKIYYEPNKLLSIKGLVELSSLSFAYDPDDVIREVEILIKESGIPFKQLVSSKQLNPILIPKIPIVTANDIYEVSDCIYSCKHFISLSSGSHSLAAAIRRKADFKQICLLPGDKYEQTLANKLFVYPDVQYVPVRAITSL